MQFLNSYRYPLAFAGAFLVYFFNLFIDIMDVDAAQYASIAREMVASGNYLEVYHREADYLDKPPLLFWLSALSFSTFGIHNWSFKLPAVLALVAAVYFTYRYARRWYDATVSRNAALMLATTQAFFLMTNDVRTDGLLTSTVIFTLWQLSVYLQTRRLEPIVWAGIGLGLGLMAKGPVAAIIVGAGIGGHLLLTGQWRRIFDVRWLLLLFIALLCLLPMLYGLYTQFDLHPEKEVYGLSGPSGIKFFFWTQSFGRITGDIYWSNNTGPFYFLNTMLWDFQPWVWLVYASVVAAVIGLFRRSPSPEYISLSGFVLPLIALSASNYKLPHYVFVLFPMGSVLAATWFHGLSETWKTRLQGFQFGLMHLYFALGGLSLFYFFPEHRPLIILGWAAAFFLFWWTFLRTPKRQDGQLIFPTTVAAVALGLVMSTSFYPQLLQYQARSRVGKQIHAMQVPQDRFYSFGEISFALDFYARRTVPLADSAAVAHYPVNTYIYTDTEGKAFLDEHAPNQYTTKQSYDDFRVTQLHPKFLNPATRSEKTKKTYLLKKLK